MPKLISWIREDVAAVLEQQHPGLEIVGINKRHRRADRREETMHVEKRQLPKRLREDAELLRAERQAASREHHHDHCQRRTAARRIPRRILRRIVADPPRASLEKSGFLTRRQPAGR